MIKASGVLNLDNEGRWLIENWRVAVEGIKHQIQDIEGDLYCSSDVASIIQAIIGLDYTEEDRKEHDNMTEEEQQHDCFVGWWQDSNFNFHSRKVFIDIKFKTTEWEIR